MQENVPDLRHPMSNDLNNNHHSYHYENGHSNGDDIVNLSSGFTDNSMDIVCHSVKKVKVSSKQVQNLNFVI